MKVDSAQRVRASYPLAALALSVTAAASMLVCADIDRLGEQYVWLSAGWPWRPVMLFGGAAVLGGLIGAVYAIVSTTGWRARLIAPLAGIVAGQIGVLLLVAPGPMWRTIFAVGVLLAAAVLFRLGAE